MASSDVSAPPAAAAMDVVGADIITLQTDLAAMQIQMGILTQNMGKHVEVNQIEEIVGHLQAKFVSEEFWKVEATRAVAATATQVNECRDAVVLMKGEVDTIVHHAQATFKQHVEAMEVADGFTKRLSRA